MKMSIKLWATIAVMLLIAGTANACNISISSLNVGLKGEYDNTFSETINAPKNSDISIKIQFDIDSYSGNDCPASINAKAIIYRYNNNQNKWEQYKTTSTKSQSLSNGTVILTWTNEFNTGTNDNYNQYKVEGQTIKDSTILDRQEAIADVTDNSCSGIKLITNDITIDEGKTSTRTFKIQNDTDSGFNIDSIDLLTMSALIRSANIDYSNYVPSHSSKTITLTFETGYVSNNTQVSERIEVNGKLANTTCSKYEIGVQTFQITVRNTGTNDYEDEYYDDYYYEYPLSTECSNLILTAENFSIEEGETQNIIFNLKNNSTQRFEIQTIQYTTNGIQLSTVDNDKYIHPGQIGSITLKAQAPNVTGDKEYNNSIKITGRFAGGKTCSQNEITQAFAGTVIEFAQTNPLTCKNFTLTAPTSITINNYGTLPFTINNQTNRKVDIYIEGSVNATPTIITIPTGTAISRALNISADEKTGYLTFRPVIEGCAPPITSVNIINNSPDANTTMTQTGGEKNPVGLFIAGGLAETLIILILITLVTIIIAAMIIKYSKNNNQKEENNQIWMNQKQ